MLHWTIITLAGVFAKRHYTHYTNYCQGLRKTFTGETNLICGAVPPSYQRRIKATCQTNCFLKPLLITRLHCGRSAHCQSYVLVFILTKTKKFLWPSLLHHRDRLSLSLSSSFSSPYLPPSTLLWLTVRAFHNSCRPRSVSWGQSWLWIPARVTAGAQAAAEHAPARGDAGVYWHIAESWRMLVRGHRLRFALSPVGLFQSLTVCL